MHVLKIKKAGFLSSSSYIKVSFHEISIISVISTHPKELRFYAQLFFRIFSGTIWTDFLKCRGLFRTQHFQNIWNIFFVWNQSITQVKVRIDK